MTAVDEWAALDTETNELAATFVAWLESGVRPQEMFDPNVFVDLSLPHWRVQAQGADAAFHVREDSHPSTGRVAVEALDRTSRGFLIQFTERWNAEGQAWYCRELIHCVVAGGRITELVVYCTGDWDEAVQARHAAQVRLVRS